MKKTGTASIATLRFGKATHNGGNMITTLSAVIKTLDTIEVRGKENLDALLGCILTLERLVSQLENHPKDEEVKDG